MKVFHKNRLWDILENRDYIRDELIRIHFSYEERRMVFQCDSKYYLVNYHFRISNFKPRYCFDECEVGMVKCEHVEPEFTTKLQVDWKGVR